jgi:hypothetical protein
MPKNVITGKILKNLLSKKARVRIHGVFYYATTDRKFVVGDAVLDRYDGTYGFIHMFHDKRGRAVVGDEGVTECGVSLTRLIKLKKFNEGNVN